MSELESFVEARIAAGDLELPVFPSSAQEVLALCDSSDVDAKQLADVIRRDASLAGHFLALANSAAFGARVPLVSLQQALTRVGTAMTKQIAIVIACKTRAFVIPGQPDRAKEFLSHALTTALYAQEIARARRLNVEEAFLGGLLHDIGTPTLLQLCTAAAQADGDPSSIEACAHRFHARVGGMIAASWAMRNSVADIIANHHATLSANDSSKMNGIAIVQLADAFAHGTRDVSGHPATNLLNLYPADIERILARVDALSSSEKS